MGGGRYVCPPAYFIDETTLVASLKFLCEGATLKVIGSGQLIPCTKLESNCVCRTAHLSTFGWHRIN